jgi:hypothetical protein
MGMREEVARAVLKARPAKLDLSGARSVLTAWAEASGWEQDRWGNYHPGPGRRVKFTARVMQRQNKIEGEWRNVSSTPLISAATNVLHKAAEAVGDEGAVASMAAAKERRVTSRKKAQGRAADKAARANAEAIAAKLISVEMPVEFAALHDTGHATREFQARFSDIVRSVQGLRAISKEPTDQDLFRSTHPPLAPLLVSGIQAEWVEDVRGVPYTVTVRHSRKNEAIIEIGTTAAGGMLGHRIDPVTMSVSSLMSVGREGDGYLSGRIVRGERGPHGALFMISAQQRQQGSGGRILDLWCNLMEAYGARFWVAEAVGKEGEAFFQAKIRAGRLEEIERRGSNIIMRCLGGPEARQQQLPGVRLKPNLEPSGYEWSPDDVLQEWREALAREPELPPQGHPNPLLWLWERYSRNPWENDMYARAYGVRAYAWAVPDDETIDLLVQLGPLAEVGAGRGYWAKLLSEAGADIVATDPYAPDGGTFYPVEPLDAAEAARKYADRTLLLIWPPRKDPAALDALRAYTEAGGRQVAFIGEDRYGCTAEPRFFSYLSKHWEQEGWHDIPRWSDFSDALTTYGRA